MTRTVDVREAEVRLRDLVSLASAGDEVVIEDAGKALARLVPAAPTPPPRVAGLNRGVIWTSDDFDAPLPDDFGMAPDPREDSPPRPAKRCSGGGR